MKGIEDVLVGWPWLNKDFTQLLEPNMIELEESDSHRWEYRQYCALSLSILGMFDDQPLKYRFDERSGLKFIERSSPFLSVRTYENGNVDVSIVLVEGEAVTLDYLGLRIYDRKNARANLKTLSTSGGKVLSGKRLLNYVFLEDVARKTLTGLRYRTQRFVTSDLYPSQRKDGFYKIVDLKYTVNDPDSVMFLDTRLELVGSSDGNEALTKLVKEYFQSLPDEGLFPDGDSVYNYLKNMTNVEENIAWFWVSLNANENLLFNIRNLKNLDDVLSKTLFIKHCVFLMLAKKESLKSLLYSLKHFYAIYIAGIGSSYNIEVENKYLALKSIVNRDKLPQLYDQNVSASPEIFINNLKQVRNYTVERFGRGDYCERFKYLEITSKKGY